MILFHIFARELLRRLATWRRFKRGVRFLITEAIAARSEAVQVEWLVREINRLRAEVMVLRGTEGATVPCALCGVVITYADAVRTADALILCQRCGWADLA
jgi:predicted RNA-binding Zn-ribbon protein involved in translation (DUF1610 family)